MKEFISSIFGKSPVAPLQKHMKACHDCANLLVGLFDAAVEGDLVAMQSFRDQIVTLEDEADQLKFSIRSHLQRSVFMPVARNDLLDLILVQDKIANRCRDISGIMVGRKMSIPEPAAELFRKFVRKCVKAVKHAHKSINELDELFETSFRGAEMELVQNMIHRIDEIESESDALQQQLRHQLYAIESNYPPIDMMFLYNVITLIGEVGDMSERTGRRLEMMFNR